MNLNKMEDFKKLKLEDLLLKESNCFCDKKNKLFECKVCKINNKQNLFDILNLKKMQWKKDFDNLNSNNCLMKEKIKHNIKCTTKNINAHTISKSENFSSELDWFKFESGNIYRKKALKLKKYGIGTASTFKGFCKIHDEMFNSADNGFLDSNFIAQLVYRQISFEIYQREKNLYNQEKEKEFLEKVKLNLINRYKNYIDIDNFKSAISAYKIVTEDLKKKRKIIENMFMDQMYDNKLNLTLKEEYKDSFYFKKCELDKDFKVNISTLYSPKLKVNGRFFNNKKYNISENLFIFVLNSRESPILIIACDKKNKDLIEFIDDFFNLKDIENRLLKYSILFDNVYFSKKFTNELLSNEIKKYLRHLYLKHDELLQLSNFFISPKLKNKVDHKGELLNEYVLKNAIEYDKKIYNDLKLNIGLKYK